MMLPVLNASPAVPGAPANLRVVRIRHHTAYKGGSYRYHHADILAESAEAAMTAAIERRVKNWRQVDSFNPGQAESFSFFEVLFDDLSRTSAVDASAPVPRRPGIEFRANPDFVGDDGVSYPCYATKVRPTSNLCSAR